MSFSLYLEMDDSEITFTLLTRGWGNMGLIGYDDSPGWTEELSNPFYLEGKSGAEYSALATTSNLKKSIDQIYGQEGMGGKGLWVRRIGSSETGGMATQQPCYLIPVTGDETEDYKHWRTPNSPIQSLDGVWVDFDDGSGLIEQTSPTNYTEDAAEGGLKTGKFTFTNVIANSTGGTQSTMPSDARVYASWTYDKLGNAFRDLREKDVQFQCLSYDPNSMTSDDTYTGDLIKDMIAGKLEMNAAAVEGQFRIFVGMLPKGKSLADDSTSWGGTGVWRNVRNTLGQPKRVMLIGHKSDDDVGAAAMAVWAKTHPRLGLFLTPISVSQTENWSLTEQKDFLDNQISFVGFEKALNDAMVTQVGLTLGNGLNRMPNYVRCKDDIMFNVGVAIVGALARKTVFMNSGGVRKIKEVIRAAVESRARLRICDGLKSTYVPAQVPLDNDPFGEEAQAIKNSFMFEGVEFEFLWSGNPIKIKIGAVKGV